MSGLIEAREWCLGASERTKQAQRKHNKTAARPRGIAEILSSSSMQYLLIVGPECDVAESNDVWKEEAKHICYHQCRDYCV